MLSHRFPRLSFRGNGSAGIDVIFKTTKKLDRCCTVNDRRLTIRALDMALRRRCPEAGLRHHSDQGSTFADYQAILDTHGITCSMSRRGNCYDDAAMGSFFSTVDRELAEQFGGLSDGRTEVFYNRRRRHPTIGYVSPAVFECQAAAHPTSGSVVMPELEGNTEGIAQHDSTDGRRV
ncbi:hypothetical protein BH23BAC4_BH23BAC4_12150 [soil metagenome]